MFWKKKPKPTTIEDPLLGTLVFEHGAWGVTLTDQDVGEFWLTIEGTAEGPDDQPLEDAIVIVAQAKEAVAAAKAFLLADAQSLEFMEYNGELDFDGFHVRSPAGSYSACFGLTLWPDASLDVRFERGKPVEAWLGD